MIFITGGAYQGKLDYARSTFHLSDADIFTCTGGEIDFSRRCICHLERFTLACLRQGQEPLAYFAARRPLWQDSILICRDIFCGVVPLDGEQRRWRQETGRLCQYLSREAGQVSRIFCGLEQRLK